MTSISFSVSWRHHCHSFQYSFDIRPRAGSRRSTAFFDTDAADRETFLCRWAHLDCVNTSNLAECMSNVLANSVERDTSLGLAQDDFKSLILDFWYCSMEQLRTYLRHFLTHRELIIWQCMRLRQTTVRQYNDQQVIKNFYRSFIRHV